MSNRRNGGLDSAMRGMSQSNFNLEVFQETKVTNGIHTRASLGYHVFANQRSKSAPWEGLAIFYRYSPKTEVKVLKHHKRNILSFQVVSGGY